MFKILRIFSNIYRKRNKVHCLNIKEKKKEKKKKIAWCGVFDSDMLNNTCPICLEKNNMTIKLPCNHWFHKDCILNWFQHSNNCPLCRLNIRNSINKYLVII
jgi:SUMO ligase MMS21 Smc5/6 complex component